MSAGRGERETRVVTLAAAVAVLTIGGLAMSHMVGAYAELWHELGFLPAIADRLAERRSAVEESDGSKPPPSRLRPGRRSAPRSIPG